VITVALDSIAIATVGVVYIYGADAKTCLPAGFMHAQWPKWIWCTFAARETLAAGLLAAAGTFIAAGIAAYAVWLQIRLSLYSREEDRIEKVLPAYIEAAQTLSDFDQKLTDMGKVDASTALVPELSLAIKDDIESLPNYIRTHMLSADDRLKRNTEVLINSFLNAASRICKLVLDVQISKFNEELNPAGSLKGRKQSEAELVNARIDFHAMHSILSMRKTYLDGQIQSMERRRQSYRKTIDDALGSHPEDHARRPGR
jgi:hypothetical protein